MADNAIRKHPFYQYIVQSGRTVPQYGRDIKASNAALYTWIHGTVYPSDYFLDIMVKESGGRVTPDMFNYAAKKL